MGRIQLNQVQKVFGNVEVIPPLDLEINEGEFVGFIGSPRMNLIEGVEAKKHDAETIGIRPEHLTVSESAGTWKGRVGVAEHLGSDTFIHVHDTGLMELMTVRIAGDIEVLHGDIIYLTPFADKIHRFDAQGLRIT